MTEQNTPITQADYLNEPGYGLPSRDQMHTIACRLIHQTKGTIAGISPDGTLTGKPWHKGNLTIEQAVYAVQYALSRGLNPFGDVHIWYFQKLQVCEHYRILAGWAQLRQPYVDHYREVTNSAERAKHKLTQGDLAVVCTILRTIDRELFIGCLQSGMSGKEALDIAGISAIGVIKAPEMQDKEGKAKEIDVRGWTWLQRAETRALRNALGRSHGNPTPAEIIAYSQKLNPNLSPALLAHPDFDPSLPPEAQQRSLGLISQAEQIQAEWATMTPEELSERAKRNVILMRGPDEEGID